MSMLLIRLGVVRQGSQSWSMKRCRECSYEEKGDFMGILAVLLVVLLVVILV
jgi:hypothetical protein